MPRKRAVGQNAKHETDGGESSFWQWYSAGNKLLSKPLKLNEQFAA